MTARPTLELFIESDGNRWEDVWVHRLEAREAISEPFAYGVELFVIDPERDLEGRAVPGVEVSLVFEHAGLEVRRIHGVLGPVHDRMEGGGARRTYALRILPRWTRLASIQTQEIFLDLTIPQILQRKLEMHGFTPRDFELRLAAEYDVREIVVQYDETDLAFVSRLAEHVGISYFFEHDGGVDKVVFTDHLAGFHLGDDDDQVAFHARGEALGVHALERVTAPVPARYFVQDYNYRTPLLDPTGSFELDPDGDGGVVEYGSHVKSPEDATRLAQIRAEERAATRDVFRGRGSATSLSAGHHFTLLDHPRLAGSDELLVTEVHLEGSFPSFEQPDEPAVFTNRFSAIRKGAPFRPARRTPKPRMPGFVTGVIQPGPNGEIGGVAKLTDDGRYTVQIHFDTAVRGQQKSSHPVRMAQPFAGHGNSMHFPLLPGTEVLVAFANGDPDRPIIVGALHNPVSPSTIVDDEAHTHRIRSSQGVIIEFGNTVPGRS